MATAARVKYPHACIGVFDWNKIEIKSSISAVVEAAAELGYNIDAMAIGGGSAGGTLAMLYAYRDADESPIPVTMLFEAVGLSSFYAEDWNTYFPEFARVESALKFLRSR